jgi:polysaccharide export outer membrane protein
MHIKSILLLFLIAGLASCVNTKKITYFNDVVKANGSDMANQYRQLRVQPGDVIQITITTLDKDVSLIFNPQSAAASSSTGIGMDPGYLVDSAGYISLPMVGKVLVKDKTTSEINTLVAQELDKSVRNAYVSTRVTNFRVSVLGDVVRPGSFKVPAERISVLDALSMAGDLNTSAIRDDIMLIREVNGEKQYASLNLNDSKILSSPYYYLNNNDVIYVKPGPNKTFGSSRFVALLPAVISAFSLITTVLILTIK